MATLTAVHRHFWLFTLGLILVWVIVLATAAPSGTEVIKTVSVSSSIWENKNLNKSNVKEAYMHERNCKNLCKHCGCMGFYCGEECICECNNNDNKDTECIATMQQNARKLNIPFQLLIQGPNSNRFVRKSFHYSQDANAGSNIGKAAMLPNRNKRSNVVIYRPPVPVLNLLDVVQKPTLDKYENLRPKRSVAQFDWFTDLANNLVRPAPLGVSKKSTHSTDAVEPTQFKRAINKGELDRSWFAEHTNLLLRPAPFFKRMRKAESDADTRNNANSLESPMVGAVENIPKVLKDTLRSLQESTIGNGDVAYEFGDKLRSQIKEGANMLQSQLTENNLEFLPTSETFRDNLQQTLSDIRSKLFPNAEDDRRQTARQERNTSLKSSSEKNKKFTWFRPIRFMQRVQQAIH